MMLSEWRQNKSVRHVRCRVGLQSILLLFAFGVLLPASTKQRAPDDLDGKLESLNAINNPSLRGPILRLGPTDEIHLAGWATDHEHFRVASAVEALIDGKIYPLHYGVDRPDVAEYLHRYTYRWSGFDDRIPVKQIGAGQHQLILRIWSTPDQVVVYRPLIFQVDPVDKSALYIGGAAALQALGCFLSVLLVLWIPARLLASEIVRRIAMRERDLDLVTMLVVGLLGYAAFWVYWFNPLVGRAFSICCIAAGAILAYRNRSRLKAQVIDRTTLLLTSVGILYIACLSLHAPAKIEDIFVRNNFLFESQSLDNRIPLLFANAIIHPPRTPAPRGQWISSDRPPLQTGMLLYTWPLCDAVGEDLIYQELGMFAQLLFLVGTGAMLINLGARERQAGFVQFLLATSGFLYYSSVYVWPKLLAAAFCAAAVAVLARAWKAEEKLAKTDLYILGVSVPLALLSHGGVASTIAILALLTLWRFRSFLRMGWRVLAAAAMLACSLYLPWIYYQRYIDPPGDRLIKINLAGDFGLDNKGAADVIVDAYRHLTLSDWLKTRKSHLDQVVHYSVVDEDMVQCARLIWSGKGRLTMPLPAQRMTLLSSLPATLRSLAALIRFDQTEVILRSLGLLNLAWPLFLAGVIYKRRSYWRGNPAVLPLGIGILSLLLWNLLLFNPLYFMVKNVCHGALLLLFVSAALIVYSLPEKLRFAFAGIHVLCNFAIWVWLVPTDSAASQLSLRPGVSVVSVLLGLGAFAAFARFCFPPEPTLAPTPKLEQEVTV
jgi:hypothetical protein